MSHLFYLLLHLLVGPQHFLGTMELHLQPSDLQWWEMPVRILLQTWAETSPEGRRDPVPFQPKPFLFYDWSQGSPLRLPIPAPGTWQ